MDEGDVSAPKHTSITVPRPSEPLGLYYSFNTVIDLAKGRKKGVDWRRKGSEEAKCYKRHTWGQQKNGKVNTLREFSFASKIFLSSVGHRSNTQRSN